MNGSSLPRRRRGVAALSIEQAAEDLPDRDAFDPLAESLARWRAALLGGFVPTSEIMEQRLRTRGFVDVARLPELATALTAMIVGRRPPLGSPNAAQFGK